MNNSKVLDVVSPCGSRPISKIFEKDLILSESKLTLEKISESKEKFYLFIPKTELYGFTPPKLKKNIVHKQEIISNNLIQR